jgi:hypothetical protein
MKQALAAVLKAIAGVAAVVCILTPVAGLGIVVFVIAFPVAVIAGVAGSHLSDDESGGGYWPEDPKNDGPSGSG